MYFCLSCKLCWTNDIIILMLKINMESDQFIQGDDLWALHYGYDPDHALTGTKAIFSYLELIIRSELEPNYGVCDAPYHNSYELASKLRLNAPRRTTYLGLPSQWMSRPFITQRHIQMRAASKCGVSSSWCTCSCFFLASCSVLVSCSFARSSPLICGNTRSEILLIWCWVWSLCGNPGLHQPP